MKESRKSKSPISEIQSIIIIFMGILLIVIGILLFIDDLPAYGMNVFTAVGAALLLAGFFGYINSITLKRELRPYTSLSEEIVERQLTNIKFFKHGLDEIYETRHDAIKQFINHIKYEKEKVIVIGCSLKGFIGQDIEKETTDYGEAIDAIKRAYKNGSKLCFLVTHPQIAHHRSKQENRERGHIEKEIIINIIFLLRIKFKELKEAKDKFQIRLYRGTPTIFSIISSSKMLLNPYPYHAEARNSYCFEINGESPIYNKYHTYHFKIPWESDSAEKLPDDLSEAKRTLISFIEGETDDTNIRIIPDPKDRDFLIGLINEL